MVTLPLGTTTITLLVNDGQEDSLPDTADVSVTVGVAGLNSPMAALVLLGNQVPYPDKAFKQGRTVPLKLQLYCNGIALTNTDVSGPVLANLVRNGDAIDLPIDPDAGNSNSGDTSFRFEDGSWIYNFSTKDLSVGTYTLTLQMPDERLFQTGFVLR